MNGALWSERLKAPPYPMQQQPPTAKDTNNAMVTAKQYPKLPSPTPKFRSWADDEDENVNAVSPPPEKQGSINPRFAILESKVAQAEEQISNLVLQSEKKGQYIQKLETAIGMHDSQMKELATTIQGMGRRIQQLEAERVEKIVYGNVSCPQNNTEEMEEELKPVESDGFTEVRSLRASLPSSASTSPKNSASMSPTLVPDGINCANLEPSRDELKGLDTTTEKVRDVKIALKDGPKTSDTTMEQVGDVTSTQKSPQIKPTANIKSAPKLSFPIKNGGKIQGPKSTANGNRSSRAASTSNRTWTHGSFFQDIRDMKMDERAELFQGPSISIFVGSQQIRNVSKHMFMAVSVKARQRFLASPNETFYDIADDSVDFEMVQTIVNWFTAMGSSKAVFSLKLRTDTDEHNLKLRHAALVMGMDLYVRHFTKQYCDKIRNLQLPLNMLPMVDANASDNDPVLLCLANNLVHARSMNKVTKPTELEAQLAKCPRLGRTVADIEEQSRARRSGQTSRAGSTAGSINRAASETGSSNAVKGNEEKGSGEKKKTGGGRKKKKKAQLMQQQNYLSQGVRVISADEASRLRLLAS